MYIHKHTLSRTQNAPGIQFGGAPGLVISNVSLEVPTTAPGVQPVGALPSSNAVGISGSATRGVVITHVRARGGSSGVYLVDCPSALVSFVEGHEMRGPFPRGQYVRHVTASVHVAPHVSNAWVGSQ